MNDDYGSCEVFWELEDRARAGAALSPGDEEFRVEHRRSCTLCGFERQVAALAAGLDDAGPAVPMSAAEDERFYHGVLRELAADERRAEPAAASRPRAFTSTFKRLALAAAFMSLAIIIAASVYMLRAGKAGGGRMFVVAGTTTAGATVVRGGDALKEGDALTIARGYAGFVPCYDVEVFADESSRVKIARLGKTQCELSLEYGRVVTRAIAIPAGARLVVSTQSGSVEVKGTVFTVETDGVDTKVRVMEGAVLVRNRKGLEQRVASSMKISMNSGETGRITQDEIDRDHGLAGWYDPGVNRGLGAFVPVEIQSVPDGAEIVMAQKTIGRTPLSALVPPGRYNIEVQAAGFETLGEVLSVDAQGALTRKYLLKRKAPQAAAPRIEEPAEVRETPEKPVTVKPEPAKPRKVARLATAGNDGISRPDLLEVARLLKEQKDFRGAAGAYDEIIAKFPASPEAKVAIVHLGFIHLDRLREPAKALGRFERYLGEAENGILREEASWGRIKAFRAMDQEANEAGALRVFISKYASSLYLDEAKRWLGELERGRERR